MNSPLLGSVILGALRAAGVEHLVVCPGSRSTPITLAAPAAGLRVHTRTDERAAGFLALGLARAAGIAAVVVTSGTAVANLHPAVLEARHAGVPLVVITADRPLTLIGSGANQTTTQIGIFADHVVDQLVLSSADAAPQAWGQAMARVVHAALGTRTATPGPVHVNAMFDAPLVGQETVAVSGIDVAPRLPAAPTPLPWREGTVVLVGDASPDQGRWARELAENARLPLLAEPSSNARSGKALSAYRLLLDGELGARITRVIMVGHPTLSRPVTRLLSRPDVEVVAVTDRAQWNDPGHRVTRVVDAVDLPPDPTDWVDTWYAADAAASAELSRRTGPQEQIRALLGAIIASDPAHIVWGASQTIRHADLADVPARATTRHWANRGLAGIDGTIATAGGIALATGEPVTAVMGDLTFLHDLGALHVPTGQPIPRVRVIVVDDDGGAIFSTLEVAGTDGFDALFTMPHGRDLAGLAAQFAPTVSLGLAEAVEAARADALPDDGVIIVRA